MRERFQLPIPFWRVQYQLLGGHQRVLFLTLLYAIVIVIGGVAFQRILRNQPLSAVCAMMLNGLLAIQAFLILIGGSNAVHRAMARDYESRMLESHRLTPMSNIGVALGYLIGPNLQVLMLFAVTLIVGLGVCGVGQLSLGDWGAGNMLLLVSAIMIWSGVVLSGMRPAKPVSPAWVLIGIAGLSLPLSLVPGTGLFLGVYPVILGVWVSTGRVAASEPAILFVCCISLVLTVFWLSAAAVKYRRPDLPALNASRGMVLLVLWSVISVGGLAIYVAVTKTSFPWLRDEAAIEIQWLGTLIVSLAIAVLVTIGAAECRIAVRRGRQPRGWGDRASDFAVVVISAIVICGISASLGQSLWVQFAPRAAALGEMPYWAFRSWGLTLATMLLALVTARSLYRLAACRIGFKSPLIATCALLVALWALTSAIEAIRVQAVAGFNGDARYSFLMATSPNGLLAVVWMNLNASLMPGLIFQMIVAAAVTFLARRPALLKTPSP